MTFIFSLYAGAKTKALKYTTGKDSLDESEAELKLQKMALAIH